MSRLASAVLAVSLWFGVGLSAQQTGALSLRASAEREAARLAATLAADDPSSKRSTDFKIRVAQTSDRDPMQERPNWAARHPVFLGALISAGAGGVFGHVSRNFNAFVAIPGAVEGAFVGLIVSAVQNANRKYEGSGTPDIIAIRRVVAAVGVGGGIEVTLGNGQQMTGRVRAVGQSDFVILPDGDTRSVQTAYGDVGAVRAKILSGGDKVGLAAGIAFNVITLWGIESLQSHPIFDLK